MNSKVFDPHNARLLSAQFKFGGTRPLVQLLELSRGISRQAAAAQVRRWVKAGLLQEEGNHRPKTYTLTRLETFEHTFMLDNFDEHMVWSETLRPVIARFAGAVALKIWDYGVTEMLNNAKDHSQGSSVHVQIGITGAYATLILSDNGEGIFKRITRLCGLADERLALLELAKGKLTTDPTRHSGEGIFFTSRAFDQFQIQSGDLIFDHTDRHEDALLENRESKPGTTVVLRLCHATERVLRSVFDSYSTADQDEGLSLFNKTVIPVRLARFGSESVVSRSQAQRVLARVENFKSVVLDFSEVDSIGQGFADEIFRVFKQQHPDVDIKIVHANEDVQYMIGRVRPVQNTDSTLPQLMHNKPTAV